MPTTVTLTTEELRAIVAAAVREQTEPLALQVHRLEATLRSKVSAPVVKLTAAEAAARLRKHVKTVHRLLAKRLFTDCRGGKASGSPWLIYADELDVYDTDGEEALARFRERMGRE